MPSRFYFPSAGGPPLTPTLGTGWEISTAYTSHSSPSTKSGSAQANGTARTKGSTTANSDRLDRVYVTTDRLEAQTITGTFSAVLRGLSSVATADSWLNIMIRVITPAGAVRGTLYAGTTATTPSATTSAENGEIGTATSTRIKNALALTSVAAQQGDRLQFEIGYRGSGTVSTVSTTFRYGDAAATDFALTAALTTDLAPWIELSQNLTFMAAENRAARISALTDTYTLDSGMPTGTSYTILGWFKVNIDANDYQIMFNIRGGTRDIWVETGADGTTLEMSTAGTTSGTGDATGLRALSLNTWYRIALVINGTTQTLYHGPETGSLTASLPATAPPDQFVPTQIQIGRDNNSAWLRGDIAGVKLYNRALSASEVVDELAQYKAAVLPVRGEYTMWAGASLVDSSGGGFNLTGGATTPASVDGPPIPLNPPSSSAVLSPFFHVLA